MAVLCIRVSRARTFCSWAACRGLAGEIAAQFSDLEIQARMFGPLVLGCDHELGWLHAVAHVTDLLGVSARTGSS